MNQSEKLDQLATALAKAQASLSGAKKSALNPHFKNNYATLQDVWDAAREVLAPNGLSVVQSYEATDGKLMNIRTTLLHTSGQWIAGVLSMAPQQATPQGIASASTYGRRYGLASILGIVADEDDDGNNAEEPGRAKPVYRAEPPSHAQVRRVEADKADLKSMAPKPVHVPRDAVNADALDWRSFTVPKFIAKYAGQTLGDMPQKDLLWWAGSYVPKPWKGEIQQKDLDLRAAFDAAQAELSGESRATPPAANEADVPF